MLVLIDIIISAIYTHWMSVAGGLLYTAPWNQTVSDAVVTNNSLTKLVNLCHPMQVIIRIPKGDNNN